MSDGKEIVLKDAESAIGKVVKQKPMKVALEEEDFTEAMKTIIRRDYFPDNQKLEAQLAYIEATESNDLVKLREISERFATDLIQTPTATPLSWVNNKRPNSGDVSDERPLPPKISKPEDSKTLDTFLQKYHSEDDASFGEIMKREEAKRKEKYSWMYEREALAESLSRPAITSGKDDDIKRLEGGGESIAITDGSQTDANKSGEIKMWKYTAKNSLMYVPDGVELSPDEAIKRKLGREIKQSNTRLSRDFLKKMATAGSPGDSEEAQDRQKQLQREKIGIDGKQIGVAESPRVQGYGFVATPQINPGVDASPLMTWGTIEGTPLQIQVDTDVTSTPGPVFKIPKESVRDGIGLRLASKASKSQRVKKKAAIAQAASTILGSSPSIRSPIGSTSDKLRLLSPAARKLIRQSTTPGTMKGDRFLRASYSTPRSNMSTPKGTRAFTPSSYHHQGGNTPVTPSLTDNLLNLK